ncbi:MAG: coenzyme F420-0:L-glutamate ligase [Alphaproteobacteria bacterium]|jgi:coenzyme F420-0:L-glutamate ligase/coenzyme F420-1:gamma-L-glutamate ligase|nr:coenzyme F420-0:L-glutamate ligase [Alphaproteobacteria bacterium]
MKTSRLQLIALPDLPMVRPGDDLADLILQGVAGAGETLRDDDVLVVAQKIVSKANGRIVDLRGITPSEQATALAAEVDKDPRLIELILAESTEVVAKRPGVIVVAHRLGIVLANAGIDASNVEQEGDSEHVLLLPEDPDADCRALCQALRDRLGVALAVVINDSVGRAWRNGTMGLAIGSAGLPALWDLRGEPDLYGRELQVSEVGLADQLASAASLLQGEGSQGQPVVLVRGLRFPGSDQGAGALLRPAEQDMFR